MYLFQILAHQANNKVSGKAAKLFFSFSTNGLCAALQKVEHMKPDLVRPSHAYGSGAVIVDIFRRKLKWH